MVNVVMVTTTGSEQSAIPHLPGASVAGVAPASFLKSFEGSISEGIGKSSMPLGVSADLVGAKSAVSRHGLIRFKGNEAADGAKVPTDVSEPSRDTQRSPGKRSETSAQGVVVQDSENGGSAQHPSEVVWENSPDPRVLPAQRPDIERSINLSAEERRSEKPAVTGVRESGNETETKAKPGSRKVAASSDASAVATNTAGRNMLPDPPVRSLASQPREVVAPVVVPSNIVQPVQDSKGETCVPNLSAAGRVNKRAQGLKVLASSKEELAVVGARERSARVARDDDGARVQPPNVDDSSKFSGHGASVSPSDGTGKSHGASGGEVQVMPFSPLMKEQVHTLTGSSAGRDVSVSASSHASLRGESAAFEQPGASAGEHRAVAASPTMLEVGVPGGSHGWLKIRAELAGDGAVHASVSSSSTAGEEMLRRELPSLTTYLHQEQVAVGSLVVHASAGAQDSSSMPSGTAENSAGRQQQGDAQHGRDQQDAGSFRERNERSWANGVEEAGITAWLPQAMYAGNGGWLSVRA